MVTASIIKRFMLLGRKAMTNLGCILKAKMSLLTKICVVKAMVFPVIMYKCESGTIKRAEHWKPDAFELWCCRRLKRLSSSSSSRRLSRVPWTRRSNQSLLKEVNPECSLEGLMLKLKLQYFGHLTWRDDSLEKPLMLGKEKGTREEEKVGWCNWVDEHEFEQTQGDNEG